MRRLRFFVLSALLVLTASAGWARVETLLQQTPRKVQSLRNPFEGQPAATRAGAKLFARECAGCHGSDALGIGKAPPLIQFEVREAAPGALFWILRNGSLRYGMPSFAHLPEAQRWQIITYLKALKSQ